MSISKKITRGSTRRFLMTAKKDGVIWDLTGATVTVIFTIGYDDVDDDDADQVVTKTGTILSAAAGTAYYVTLTTDLVTLGRWRVQFRVVQGAIDITSDPYEFEVIP